MCKITRIPQEAWKRAPNFQGLWFVWTRAFRFEWLKVLFLTPDPSLILSVLEVCWLNMDPELTVLYAEEYHLFQIIISVEICWKFYRGGNTVIFASKTFLLLHLHVKNQSKVLTHMRMTIFFMKRYTSSAVLPSLQKAFPMISYHFKNVNTNNSDDVQ